MDYFSVTQTAYFAAASMSFVLVALLCFASFKNPLLTPLIIGFTAQFGWSLYIALSYSKPNSSSDTGLYVEIGHLFFWTLCLGLALVKQNPIGKWPALTRLTFLLTLLSTTLNMTLLFFSAADHATFSALLLLSSIFLIILAEQVMRNETSNRLIKLVSMCLIFQFILNAYIFGQLTFNQDLNSVFWQSRASVSFITATLSCLGLILFSKEMEPRKFDLSRAVKFYSTAIAVVLLSLSILSLGSWYVSRYNGYLGSYLFTVALILALVLITSLAISEKLKAQVEVFVSKHFFRLKYDYREQWLKTIKLTSDLNPGMENYFEEVLSYACLTFGSNSGVLWLHQDGNLNVASRFNFTKTIPAMPLSHTFTAPMLKSGWIYSPLSFRRPLAQHNELLPDWFAENDFWLLCPMICQMKLIGIIAITRPSKSAEVTFEDRDLINNIMDQISSQILLHRQETLIAEAKQLETYNRLSSFIMHDTNNVIAQLALVLKNAERHKDNPAFINDMLKTVNNSVQRMRSLIQKFNPDSKETNQKLVISEILTDIAVQCSDRKPEPTLEIITDFEITADKDRLSLALKNLIRNAQEATDNDGEITITCDKDAERNLNTIILRDNGKGMTQQFIERELFKPFSTTKSEDGIGIGAHLTKSYIEQLGGTLRVESAVAKGSAFHISF